MLGGLFSAMSLEPEALTACNLLGPQPSEHVMNRRHLYDRFTRLRQVFVILSQPPIPPLLRERPFHHPADGQRLETRLPFRSADHCQPIPALVTTQPTIQVVVVILAVGEDHLQ